MDIPIIGCDVELQILQEAYESTESEFVAVYGSRLGITYLIREFFKDKGFYFEITGVKDGTKAVQLHQFAYEFSRQFNKGEQISTPKNWLKAFNLLNDAVEKVEKGKKIVLFFNEVSWLASPLPQFLNALGHVWNRYLSRNRNVIMIIYGSSASWVITNIINNTGGLHGRATRKLHLLPVTD